MSEQRTDSGFQDFDDDYQVIRLSLRFGSLSILMFVTTLAVHVVGDNFGANVGQMVFATFGFTGAGLVLGLLGLKFDRGGRGAARAGVFLNGSVVGIFLIILPAVYQILKRLS